jgi:hypothetical protein
MDMDDDFMGEIEFDLAPEQRKIVGRAINLASQDSDEFRMTNPLIAIMQWWDANVPDNEKAAGTPEETLTEACRRFVRAHDK